MSDMPEFPEVPPTAAPNPTPTAATTPAPAPAAAVLTPALIRRDRRPEPRLATALAGAGCALAVLGVLTISSDALAPSGGGDGSQVPGIVLSLMLLAAGLALLSRAPDGALRTAGSVASTLAIPPLMFFVTFDEGGFPPYSTEGILAVSAAAWITLHLVGPAAGRSFPLGAGLIAAWLLVLQLIEEPFTSPFDSFAPLVEPTFGESGDFSDLPGTDFDAPDLATMGFLTLLIGATIAVVGHRLDRAGQHGRATAFALAAIVMLPAGVLLLLEELEAFGSGLFLTVIGVVIGASGALRGRRGTTWFGALFVFYGLTIIIDDIAGDSVSGFGVAAAIAGAGVVFGAHSVATALGEPDELVPGPSMLRAPSATTGTAPPTPPTTEF